MSKRRLLTALSLTATLASPALAHEIGLVQVEGTFQRDGTYVLDLLIDLEHLPPQTSGKTSTDALLRDLADSSLLSFDGRIAEPGKAEIARVAGGRSNVTRLRRRGRTPSGVSRFIFTNGAISGFFVLKLRNESQESPAIQWVEGGRASAPFPLDQAVVPPSRWKVVGLNRLEGLGWVVVGPASTSRRTSRTTTGGKC